MKEKDDVFISVAKLKSRFPPTFSWVYRKDLFKIIDDLVEKERETVFKNARSAAHCRQLILITIRIVYVPFLVLIERSVQIHEIREEPASRNLARQFIEVIVLVFWQITHSTFLLPDLYREDGSASVTHASVCAVQKFPDNASAFRRSVSSIIYRTENHLITASRMNRVHIVNKSLQSLVHT